MLTLRLEGGREGGRGEDPIGSMLPTSGDAAHMQPTDAPHPDHRHSVKIRRDVLLIITKIAIKIV